LVTTQISYDIVEDLLVQGDRLKDVLQELQDAVYLTKVLLSFLIIIMLACKYFSFTNSQLMTWCSMFVGRSWVFIPFYPFVYIIVAFKNVPPSARWIEVIFAAP